VRREVLIAVAIYSPSRDTLKIRGQPQISKAGYTLPRACTGASSPRVISVRSSTWTFRWLAAACRFRVRNIPRNPQDDDWRASRLWCRASHARGPVRPPRHHQLHTARRARGVRQEGGGPGSTLLRQTAGTAPESILLSETGSRAFPTKPLFAITAKCGVRFPQRRTPPAKRPAAWVSA